MGLTPVIDIYYKEVAMGDHLGRFEHFLLLAVMRLGEDAYGMTIRRELADHTGRDIAVGAIYTALARLELSPVSGANPVPAGGNTRALGALVYTEYVYPFELAAVILLGAWWKPA